MTIPTTAADGPRVHPGQWRLDRVELVNWGTFQGHHRIDVARQGFLLTGHSGSGKSSVVDAVAAVLTPRGKLRFNAAAADVGSRRQDRTVATYVRGAWRRQSDASTGEITSEYLRTGATWSAILLRYTDGTDRAPVTLVKLFHLQRGTNAAADVKELHLMLTEPIELLELQDLARNGIETRRIKARWPEATVTDKHSVFASRFCRVLGIAGDNALQLLHKTQSAKNLGNLDDLFRSFMLDEPRTFALASNAVEQFGELSHAHALVIEAREQVAHLRQLQPHVAAFDEHTTAAEHLTALSDSLAAFRDTWKLGLARQERDAAMQAVRTAEHDLAAAEKVVDEANRALTQAALLVQQHGGQALALQQAAVDTAEGALRRTRSARADAVADLAEVGVTFPETFAEYEELRTTVRAERKAFEERRKAAEREVLDLHEVRSEVRRREKSLTDELDALKGGRSNLDPRLLAARQVLCRATGLSPAVLPFAGELMQVRAEHSRWTGALERTLRPLSTVLLVPAVHRDAVVRAADETHLGTRLVVEVVPQRVEPARPVRAESSLVHRIEVKAGPMKAWLDSTLSRQYDYACVEDVAELADVDLGVTLAGQVKRGPRRYEKDDRSAVGDRRRWVLGFDNAEKVEHLLSLLREVRDEVKRADDALGRAARADQAARDRAMTLRFVERREWSEFDVAAADDAHRRAQQALNEILAASGDLRNAKHQHAVATQAVEDARTAERRAQEAVATTRGALAALDQVIAELEATEIPDVPAAHQRELEQRYHGVQRTITHAAIDRVTVQVANRLTAEREAARDAIAAAERAIEQIQGTFLRAWPALAGELTAAAVDRAGFIEILERLRSDRLPEFEERFFGMLESQSQRNIAQLANEIRRAPGEIRDKIVPVNTSLRRSPFDAGRFLQIKVRENRTTLVQEFLADLKTIASGSWADQDRADAESRFEVMERVMRRLASSEAGDRHWSNLCLDTRRHVTFTGIEVDAQDQQLNVHDSSAGLSGGQRQKLVIFCLAAALRYQLTPEDQDVPAYGTVVLDEAFDKADTTFTTMAMDVFQEFGFHMLLATPLKLLQTLEDYVGGIGLATCREFRDSTVDLVSIHDEALGAAGSADDVLDLQDVVPSGDAVPSGVAVPSGDAVPSGVAE